MNSLLIISLTFAFIIAGYIFLVKRFDLSYSNNNHSIDIRVNHPLSLLEAIQSNYLLFIAITATISLYWGWSPIILWVVIGALFIHFTMQTVLHERLIGENQSNENNEHIHHYFSQHNDWRKFIGLNIIRAFSALTSIILIVIISEILSEYTGGAIAIMGITLAIIVWQKNSSTKANRLFSIIIALLSVILSDRIGLYFIGSWQPLTKFPNFVIDEKWMFSIILIILFKQIRNSNSDSFAHFFTLFAKLTSYCSTALILAIIIFLVVTQPLIDAPNHTQSENTPHYLLIISLVAIVGATNLLRYINHLSRPLTINEKVPLISRKHHGRIMFEVFSIISLIFLLSSSKGIGAWSSHFLNWDASRSLMTHLNLAIDSVSSIFSDLEISRINKTSIKNIVATIFLFNGLCLLSENNHSSQFLTNNVQSLNKPNHFQEIIMQIVFYGILITILILGATINTWLLLGSLSLAGVTWILLCDSHLTLDRETSNPIILIVTAISAAITILQTIAQCWLWWSSHNWPYAVSGTLLIMCLLLLLAFHTPSLIKKYAAEREKTPLSID